MLQPLEELATSRRVTVDLYTKFGRHDQTFNNWADTNLLTFDPVPNLSYIDYNHMYYTGMKVSFTCPVL